MTSVPENLARGPGTAVVEPSRRRRGGLFRAAKDVIYLVYLYCGYVQIRDFILAALGRSRAVVVYYHRVGGCDRMSKPARAFGRDLAALKRRYECVGLAELCRRLREGERLRRRSVCVTFDDGYRDNYTTAMPILLAAGVPATFFVATGFVNTDRAFPHDRRGGGAVAGRPNLTWADLSAMQAAGYEIGSHTVDHTNLGEADADTINREVRESLAALERELGRRPRAFSFPWGKPADISRQALEAVRRAGYYAAASAYGGCNRRGGHPLMIRRVDVGNGGLSRLAVRARVAGFDPEYLRLRIKLLFTRGRVC
jgi:peptidoglycan/xylan/chitin deacetylase (PgdA/CDA1 family)